MTKKQITELIKKEIDWCRKNPDKTNMSEDWRKGFIQGLKQAITLVKLARSSHDN